MPEGPHSMSAEELRDSIRAATNERKRWQKRSRVRKRRLEDLLADQRDIEEEIHRAVGLRRGLKEGERHANWSDRERLARQHELTQLVDSLSDDRSDLEIRIGTTREGIELSAKKRGRLKAHIQRWEKEVAARRPEFGDPAIPAFGPEIDEEQQRAGLDDLALACALVEVETGFRNIFGCDNHDPSHPITIAPWCHQEVTEERVQQLLEFVHNGGLSNGVGLTQLTFPPLIEVAEGFGGAHVPRFNLRAGFQHLASLISSFDLTDGVGCYNGGAGNPVQAYATIVLGARTQWQAKLG
jgi:hypothetical protein